MKKKKDKKKTPEDIIPNDVLKAHLSRYQILKQIESKPLSDFDNAIYRFSKIDDIIQSFANDKWITEDIAHNLMHHIRRILEEVIFKEYNLDQWLFMKSELETTTTTYNLKTGQKIVKRRGKGNKPASLARTYLVASLCAEIKAIAGKPCYEVVADYFENTLKEAGFNSKRIETEIRRIKKSSTMLHIVEILSNYNQLSL